MPVFVDAIEYAGADVPLTVGGKRRTIRHHAFDTETGQLAHGPAWVRVGFLTPSPSWTALAPKALRCPACAASVTRLIAELISRQLDTVLHQRCSNEKERP